jgi:hypothetical protein
MTSRKAINVWPPHPGGDAGLHAGNQEISGSRASRPIWEPQISSSAACRRPDASLAQKCSRSRPRSSGHRAAFESGSRGVRIPPSAPNKPCPTISTTWAARTDSGRDLCPGNVREQQGSPQGHASMPGYLARAATSGRSGPGRLAPCLRNSLAAGGHVLTESTYSRELVGPHVLDEILKPVTDREDVLFVGSSVDRNI